MHPEYGVLMAPHLNAQIHQHFFQVRLDMACDNEDGGKGLIVTEVRSSWRHAVLQAVPTNTCWLVTRLLNPLNRCNVKTSCRDCSSSTCDVASPSGSRVLHGHWIGSVTFFPRQNAVRWMQVNVESLPDGPKNPHGVGFVANETVLRSEKEAQRMGDLNTSRIWKIKNPNSINPLNGEPLGDAVHARLQASHVSARMSVVRKLLKLLLMR